MNESVDCRCEVCKSSIEGGATFCSQCRHYQNKSRRRLQYILGIPAVLALLLPIAANQGAAFFDWITDESRIKVIQYANPGKIVIFNNGDESVVITDFVVHFPALRNTELVTSVSLVVAENEIQEFVTAPEFRGTWNIISYRNDDDKNVLDDLLAKNTLPDTCIRPSFHLPDDANVQTIKRRSPDSNYLLPAKLTVGYFGVVANERRSISLDLETSMAFNFDCKEMSDELANSLRGVDITPSPLASDKTD